MLISSYTERQQRMKAKQHCVLRFLRDEIWSNVFVIMQLLQLSRPAVYKLVTRLEKEGLIKKHYVAELRFNIYGITTLGMLSSWDEGEVIEERPVFEPSKVKPLMINHHLDLQMARLKAEKDGWQNWVPGNLLPKGILKRPDAVVNRYSDKKIIAIELERTIKTRKRYEKIFSIYLQAIKRNEYDFVHYVCPDPAFAIRLKRMFSLIKSVPVAGQRIQISGKHRSKFPVYSLDQWPPIIWQNEMEL